jgi:excisionase family DNA binding protein
MTTTGPTVAVSAAEPATQAWLTLHDAAALLGVHVNTLRRWSDRASIRTYRTIGGHRRVAAEDVYAMARIGTARDGDNATTPLDADATAAIESVLRGDLSEGECRLRLRALGQRAGAVARGAGQGTAEAISSHLSIRRRIGEVVTKMRFAAGIGRSEVDERRWSDSLADAFILGLAESAGAIPVRVRGGDTWGGAAAGSGRGGPPQ